MNTDRLGKLLEAWRLGGDPPERTHRAKPLY